MRFAPLALGIGLLAACHEPAAGPAASVIVDSLYRVRQPFQANGAPTATELASMSPWLSAELRTLLARADSLRSAESTAAPDEKPSFVEGDLFSSLFEGPTAYSIKAAEVDSTTLPGTWRVPVHFTFVDRTTAQKWTDTALVVMEDGRPVVSDVRYGGEWDFANKGSLLTSLTFSFLPGPAAR
ncbi:MAG TPA: hypothetical protein VG817_06715 [Gemmatimonadales bacterium]|nr:hypothetical protein [Gemmatimonadales bacterium]